MNESNDFDKVSITDGLNSADYLVIDKEANNFFTSILVTYD